MSGDLSFMDAVHVASSRQVHLRCDGVIIDVATHAAGQFSCSPIEIRFAPLVAAAQPIFDCSPQTFPDRELHHRRLPGRAPHHWRSVSYVTAPISQDVSKPMSANAATTMISAVPTEDGRW